MHTLALRVKIRSLLGAKNNEERILRIYPSLSFSTPELNNTWSVAQAVIPNCGFYKLSMQSFNYPHGLWHWLG
jgi:hypothetical protein